MATSTITKQMAQALSNNANQFNSNNVTATNANIPESKKHKGLSATAVLLLLALELSTVDRPLYMPQEYKDKIYNNNTTIQSQQLNTGSPYMESLTDSYLEAITTPQEKETIITFTHTILSEYNPSLDNSRATPQDVIEALEANEKNIDVINDMVGTIADVAEESQKRKREDELALIQEYLNSTAASGNGGAPSLEDLHILKNKNGSITVYDSKSNTYTVITNGDKQQDNELDR